MNRDSLSNTTQNKGFGGKQEPHHLVTPLYIPRNQNNDGIVYPLVASLSNTHSQKWLTWITSRKNPQQKLTLLNANANNLRVIYINPNEDNRWIIWDALSAGNSHMVIADCVKINDEDLREFEQAAKSSSTAGIVVQGF